MVSPQLDVGSLVDGVQGVLQNGGLDCDLLPVDHLYCRGGGHPAGHHNQTGGGDRHGEQPPRGGSGHDFS